MATELENQNTDSSSDADSISRRIKKLSDDSSDLIKKLLQENKELKHEVLQAQYQYRLLDALMNNILKTAEERLQQAKSAKFLNE